MSELLGETEAFVTLVQSQFERTGQWDMETLENGLREALLKDGCHILEGLLNQPQAMGHYVPEGHLHEKRTKRVQSVLGSFTLSRGYYQQHQGLYFPMDRLLGLTDSYTPGMAKLMIRAAGTDGSFGEAQETLQRFAGLAVPSSQIRKMVQTIGTEIGVWNQDREELRSKAVPTLYVAYDGTGVPMRKEETQGRRGKKADGSSGSREVKLGCIFTNHTVDEHGHPVRDPDSTTYVASFEKAERFGSLMRQEARLRGLGRSHRSVVVGDGAHWIWNLARINFPQAVQILDFYHACEHLNNLTEIIFNNDKNQKDKTYKRWKKYLKQDHVCKVIEKARDLLPHHGQRRKDTLKEIGYFESNIKRMQYKTFRKKGFFIGSGVIEAGCKTVVGKRTKQSGMFWRLNGAQNILNIRCSILSNSFDAYWRFRRNVQLDAMRTAA
ncbi:MAG: ISKra4 family transposase [Deltaproteobacteria bacterium]|nr:ISKra4 family transposase [Deltaproteobacteria bacterium]